MEPRGLETVNQLLQKHQFSLLIEEERLPEELGPLASWSFTACIICECEAAIKQLAKRLPELSSEKQTLYLSKQTLEDSVDEVESQLRDLAVNINVCESNLGKLGEKFGDDEVSLDNSKKKLKSMAEAPGIFYEESSLKSDFYSEEYSKPQKPNADNASYKPETIEVKSELPTVSNEAYPVDPRPPKLISEIPKKKKKKRVGCCGLGYR